MPPTKHALAALAWVKTSCAFAMRSLVATSSAAKLSALYNHTLRDTHAHTHMDTHAHTHLDTH